MLLALDSTTKSIMGYGTNPFATSIAFVAIYADSSGTTFTEGANDGTLQASAYNTLVAAPSAGVRRIIKSITFHNAGSNTTGALIELDNNGTKRRIVNLILGPGQTWSSDDLGSAGTFKLVNDSTPIEGGTNGSVLYNVNGIVSEIARTGTSTLVSSVSPTIATPTIITPSVQQSITSTTSGFDLINTTATTVNFAGAAQTLNIGGAASAITSLSAGSGSIVNLGGGANAAELRFLEPSASGTNYTALKAQAQAANVTYTLPAADGSNGQVLATNGSGVLSWAAGGTGGGNSGGMAFKNVLHNGEFRVAQRGTGPFTSVTTFTSNDGTYQLDRWYTLTEDASGVVAVSQTTDVPTGRLNSIGLQIKTANRKFGIAQIIEQSYGVHLTGMATSLSFKMRVTNATKLNNVKAAVFAWTGTTDTVTRDLVSSWNAGGTTPTWIANLTVENTISTFTPTTSWATYKSENFTIDTSGVKNIVVFIWSDVKDTTVDDWLYITDVQLEMGASATDFECVPLDIEQNRCERYLLVNGWKLVTASDGPRMFGGFTNATTYTIGGVGSFYNVACYVDARVNLRTAMTGVTVIGTLTNDTSTTWQVFENASQTTWYVGEITFAIGGFNSGAIDAKVRKGGSAPITLGGFCTLFPTVAGNRLVFTGAEL